VKHRSATTLLFSVGALLPTPIAWAEVSDKFISVPGMWIQAILFGALAVLAGRFRWWVGLACITIPVGMLISTVGLHTSSDMGPALIKEQGPQYFYNHYATVLVVALMVALGIWIGWRHKESSPSSNDGK